MFLWNQVLCWEVTLWQGVPEIWLLLRMTFKSMTFKSGKEMTFKSGKGDKPSIIAGTHSNQLPFAQFIFDSLKLNKLHSLFRLNSHLVRNSADFEGASALKVLQFEVNPSTQ